jgi:hypothetical protein
MKLFWAIIIVFIAAAGFIVFAQSRQPDDSARVASAPPATQPQAEREEADAAHSPLFAPVPDENGESVYGAPGRNALGEDDAEQAARELADDLLSSSQQPRRIAEDGGDIVDDGGYGDSWPTSLGGGGGTGDHQHHPITTAENPWAVEGDFALGDERLAAQRLQHSIVKQDDGSMLLDDTFVIRGDGSASRPYEITWDLLMSAAETYQPRLGMQDIPERIAMLDGKHVRISGHLMFPMITGQADELLVMLNMWDGCCLGTMPSSYDALEVQLATPMAGGRQQFFNYGTVEGKFSVDPYLINDWLIGLYVLEDASLNVGM